MRPLRLASLLLLIAPLAACGDDPAPTSAVSGASGQAGTAGQGSSGTSGQSGAAGSGVAGAAGATGGFSGSSGQGGDAGSGAGGSDAGAGGAGGDVGQGGSGGFGAAGHAGVGGTMGKAGSGGSSGSSGQAGQGAQGGSGGASGGAGGGPAGGAGGSSPTTIHPGSYELVLSSLKSDCLGGLAEITSPPARIDIDQNAQGTWRAVVAFEGQAPAPFAVIETPTSLVLSGKAHGARTSPLQEGYDHQDWTQFEIPKEAGVVQAKGLFESFDGGDGGCPGTLLTGEGTLSADKNKPTGKFELPLRPGRRGEVMLPWDPVLLHLSEPLDPAALQPAISTSVALDGTSIPIPSTWAPPADGDEAVVPEALWAGTHQMVGTGLWPEGVSLQFGLIAGAADPSGNFIGVTSAAIPVIDAGAPSPSQELEQAPPGLWGDAIYLASGAECESGGCVELSTSSDTCPLPLAGLAARLTVPEGAKQLNIRFRLFVDQPEALPNTPAAHVALHTGVGASEPTPLTAGIEKSDLQPLTPEDPTLKLATGWRTFSTPLPELGADRRLDIDLFKGTTELAPDCIFSAASQASRLLIERVWAD